VWSDLRRSTTDCCRRPDHAGERLSPGVRVGDPQRPLGRLEGQESPHRPGRASSSRSISSAGRFVLLEDYWLTMAD